MARCAPVAFNHLSAYYQPALLEMFFVPKAMGTGSGDMNPGAHLDRMHKGFCSSISFPVWAVEKPMKAGGLQTLPGGGGRAWPLQTPL